MKLNKSIKYISITFLVIGFCVSVLWGGSLQAGSSDRLKDWVGNTVDVLTENPADNYYRVKLISIVDGNPSLLAKQISRDSSKRRSHIG